MARMRSYNTMPSNKSGNSAEPASLKFKQSHRKSPIQPWPDFSRRSAFVQSCPPTIDKVHDCIVNYKPAGTQRYPQCREFVREFDDSAFAGQIIRPAVTGNITMPQYPCDTNIISVRHLVETSERVDRIQCFDGRLAIGKYGDF